MSKLNVQLKNTHGIPLDLSFECEVGQVLALVGPSGSGKTTVLRCIAGLFRTDKGQIECDGQLWFESNKNIFMPTQQRHIGMVFQNYALFPHLTVKENIELGMEKEFSASAKELLSSMNLHGFESRMPSTLSGGQQQRVALARALARQPKILLLDEPFSAVDQVTKRKLRFELLKLIRKLKVPIILVTHDLDEAAMLADKICVLHNGKSLQTGSPIEVMRKPSSATVARLMDVRNLFEGVLIEQNATENRARISWAGIEFDAPYQQGFYINQKVNWSIPADKVLLHRRRNPSKGVRENPVSGRISEIVTVGGITNVIIELTTDSHIKLHMDLPSHVLERNRLDVGEDISMSLLKDAIHLMDHSHSSSR